MKFDLKHNLLFRWRKIPVGMMPLFLLIVNLCLFFSSTAAAYLKWNTFTKLYKKKYTLSYQILLKTNRLIFQSAILIIRSIRYTLFD